MSHSDRPSALADALLARVDRQDGDGVQHRPLRIVEAGVGERTAIAAAIAARGATVVATDVVERSVPEPVDFVRDDLLVPDRSHYRDADLLYALRLPPELHVPLARLASDLGVPAAFTTLGGDPPTVPASPEQLPVGETLYWVDGIREDAGGVATH